MWLPVFYFWLPLSAAVLMAFVRVKKIPDAEDVEDFVCEKEAPLPPRRRRVHF